MLEPLPDGYLLRTRHHHTSSTVRRPQLSLSLLGESTPTATVDEHRLELSLRHAEILTLLTMHPPGLTADQLALLLHGEHGNPTTVRAEIHRLRSYLSHGVIRTRPYRIIADITSDFDALQDALHRGDIAAAVDTHRGLLLPRSESPKIREAREEQLVTVRNSVLNSNNTEHLWHYCGTAPGQDDLEALEKLNTLLPREDPRQSTVETRLQRLWNDDT